MASVTKGPLPSSPFPFSSRMAWALSGVVSGGAAIGFFYGLAQPANRWSFALDGLVVALASAAVGAFLGLLFGVPRAFTGSTPPAEASDKNAPAGDAATGGNTRSRYVGNTNLEQVSDWLTKLLLGAGLTQLGRLPGALGDLGRYLAPGLGGPRSSSFTVVLVVFNVVAGFFLAFLLSRLWLPYIFTRAEDLAVAASATRAVLATLPPATLGPSMLQVPQKTGREDRQAVRELARRVQKIELETAGPAFDADAYRRLAQEAVAAKLYDLALQTLETGQKSYPDDPSLPLYAGAIYGMYLGDSAAATKYYFKALAVDPGFALAYYDLACNSARQDDIDGARSYLEQAYRLDPSLRLRVADDAVWDQLGLRADTRLADLVGPVDGTQAEPPPPG